MPNNSSYHIPLNADGYAIIYMVVVNNEEIRLTKGRSIAQLQCGSCTEESFDFFLSL